jgi:hypothetical protein
MFNVTIRTIPHSEQRYETVGDWQYDKTNERHVITVSELGSWKKEALIAVHELVEMILCHHNVVIEQEVDDFDIQHPELNDPGDDARAPYQREHCYATAVERMLCAALGIQWEEYEKTIAAL